MRAHNSILILCLIALGGHALLAQREIKETPVTGGDAGLLWKASLTRFQKSAEGYRPAWSTPAFRVKLNVSNHSNSKVELGGLLIVVQPAKGRQEYASVFLALHAKENGDVLRMVEDRYALQWGADVQGAMGLWPIARVMSGMNATDRFALVLQSPGAYNYAGGGFGFVSPRAQREIVEETLFPIGVKTGSSQVIVVAPSFREGHGSPAKQPIFTFDVGQFDLTSNPQSEQEFGEPRLAIVTRTPATLAATAESETEATWMRIMALNWLAETDLPAAQPVLLRLGTNKANEQIQLGAIANLGAWKIKSSVEPLLGLLESGSDSVKASVVQALGEIGESAATPPVRALLKHRKLRRFAMEAVGKLRDEESVPLLLAEVRKGTTEDSIPASDSLGMIASDSAVDGLIAIVSDQKAD